MRRDSIFFRLFQQSPDLLFELLETPPQNADLYRFVSVAVKDTKNEIDGVFLPPDSASPGTVYFTEVQFQPDQQLYERLWSESSRFFQQNRRHFCDWQAVVIDPNRKLEPRDLYPHRSLLSGDQVHRIYLDELGDIETLSVGLALMVLTTFNKRTMPKAAKQILQRTRQEVSDPAKNRAIIDMLGTIVVYKFTEMSRHEVDAMLGIRAQDTRVYREAKQEGIDEERERSLQRSRDQVVRLITRYLGKVPKKLRSRIDTLSIEQIESLGEAWLEFESMSDLTVWLDEQA